MMNFWHLNLASLPQAENLSQLLHSWREDLMVFLRHDAPKLVVVLVGAFVLIHLLRAITNRVAALQTRRLPAGFRVQQVRTLAGVLTSVGIFVILFVATMEVLSLLGLNLGPLLASAGIAGLAIGFGAQTLVKDVINGFFVLLEDQYNLGDMIRVAGVKGTVEEMSLRRTVLRDDDGAVHIVPNSEIKLVSNMTRDWTLVSLCATVAYSEPSDRVIALLQQVGSELRSDAAFAHDLMSEVQAPGIERVANGEVDYLVLVRTRPGRQFAVSRELRRRIKECFEKNNVQAGIPARVYVLDQGPDAPAS